MKNEPVAIVNTNCENSIQWNVLKPQSYNGYFLYTHPAKTLTDEEINRLWAESHEDGIAIQQGFTTQQHYFAHLILRKAQEK